MVDESVVTAVKKYLRNAARTGSRIEPVPVGQRQYEEDDSSAILEIARREGFVIPLAD
jgi:hypothetical protein